MLADDGTWIESLPLPSLVLDDTRTVVLANDAARRLLRTDVGVAVSLPLRDSAQGGPRSDERYVSGLDVEPFLAAVSWGPIHFRARDLTLVQLQRLEGEGRQHIERDRGRELLGHGVAIAELGIFEHDHLTQALWMSPECLAIYGWPENEPVTLQAMMQRAHPEDGPRVGAAVMRAHDPSGDGLCDVEGRLIRPNGEVRWVRTRSRTFFEGKERRIERTIGALVDLTEQKEREATQRRLLAALDALPNMVLIVDGTGHLEYVNASARRVLGERAVLGANLPHILPDGARARFEEAIRAALGEGCWQGEVSLQGAEGTKLDLATTLMAHRGPTGEVEFFAGIARDVTRLNELEHQLRQSQKMEAVGKLAGGIAHDFNNILSVILGYIEVNLAELEVNHPLRADLIEVESAAQRAVSLTQQLLAFSRKQVLRPQALDPAEVVSGMETMIRRILGEHIELAFMAAEPQALVRVDRSQLEQVVLNLVINARDAMPSGGKLLVETMRVELDETYVASHAEASVGPHVLLAVTDSGTGMDAATKERIFEPFFSTKGPGRGTGLGLATVHGIVRQSGGNIWVYSEPSRGTTFKVYFPVTEDVAHDAMATKPSPVASMRAGACVLLVEDDPALLRLIANILTRAGYEVIAAEGPVQALALAAQRKTIDLLLTDVVMPKMSGRQLAEALLIHHPKTPVLYMSGYTENSVVHHGVLDEGIAFLPKPVAPADLLAAVAARLAQK